MSITFIFHQMTEYQFLFFTRLLLFPLLPNINIVWRFVFEFALLLKDSLRGEHKKNMFLICSDLHFR